MINDNYFNIIHHFSWKFVLYLCPIWFLSTAIIICDIVREGTGDFVPQMLTWGEKSCES